MKGFSLIEQERQIIVTGVDGAGRNLFCSYYFPQMKRKEIVVHISRLSSKLLMIIMLDSRRLQTLAEARVLGDFVDFLKNTNGIPVKTLLVLGRIDCVCDRKQNREWVESVMREYQVYFNQNQINDFAIVAHSNLAVLRHAELQASEIDMDDIDDIRYLLAKSGHRLPGSVSVKNAKWYIATHRKALQMLSGEFFVDRFIKI